MRRALLLFPLLLAVALPAVAGEIRLSAAASLTEAVGELCADYTRLHPEFRCLPNFGASGSLAKQIAQGAPADLFLSANRKWMDYLVAEGKVSVDAVMELAGNRLVFVGAPGVRAASLPEVAGLRRIAIGSPKSVPAGEYAEEALRRANLFDRLTATGQLVMAQDVRQALVYVDRGEVDGAFVYRSDARLARKAKVLFEVPSEVHGPITYPMALTVAGVKNPDAAAFFGFLRSAEAKRVLERHGFIAR